jgi:hypothetical protein
VSFFKDGLQQGALVGLAGLIAGVITGWIGVLSGDEVAVLAARGAGWVWLLVGLLPLVLVSSSAVLGAGVDRMATLGRNTVAGLFGGLLGLALFIVGAVQIPAVFGGVDSALLMTTLRGGIGLIPVVMVLLVSFFTGLLVGAAWPKQGSK